jgi:hypothetical protein
MTMMRSLIRTAIVSGAMLLSIAPIESATSASASSAAPVVGAARAVREVTIPAGTVLRLRVNRGFGSDISRVEDPVSATLARAVVVNGRTILPAGSRASGYVTEATRPGKVRGRGRVAVRFTRIAPADESTTYNMRTNSWVAVAPATKKKDALTIGIPAAGGAVIGALVDGKKGAAIGSAAGGGAGTAVVLSTRGKEVRINRGATLAVRLTEPLTVRYD